MNDNIHIIRSKKDRRKKNRRVPRKSDRRGKDIDIHSLPRCSRCLQYPENCDCDKEIKNANSLNIRPTPTI